MYAFCAITCRSATCKHDKKGKIGGQHMPSSQSPAGGSKRAGWQPPHMPYALPSLPPASAQPPASTPTCATWVSSQMCQMPFGART